MTNDEKDYLIIEILKRIKLENIIELFKLFSEIKFDTSNHSIYLNGQNLGTMCRYNFNDIEYVESFVIRRIEINNFNLEEVIFFDVYDLINLLSMKENFDCLKLESLLYKLST